MSDALLAALAGLAAGAMLGAAARGARYCVMGAIEDAAYGDDRDRLRMLGVSAGVAILLVWTLVALGALTPLETRAMTLVPAAHAAVIGGLIFGFGMAMVGTCAFGALARIGGGDLRSLAVVSTIGVSAYAVTLGPLSGLRLRLFAPQQGGPGIAHHLGEAMTLPAILPALALGAAVLALSLLGRWRGHRTSQALWGALVGAGVALGWGATAALSGGFAAIAVESLSFAAPIGEAMLYLMTEAALTPPGFTVSGVAGVVLGAALVSALRGESRLETADDPRELGRQLIGGALMGLGGVLSLGCTIGQGLSALSLLTFSAPLVMVSIFAGARLGLWLLVEGFTGEA